MMNTLPYGIYLENDRRFEFDFIRKLFKMSVYKDAKLYGTIVSPFRILNEEEDLFLLVHNYDRTGERKIRIESVDSGELTINHENTCYKLKKVGNHARVY